MADVTRDLNAAFAKAMDRIGPFPSRPTLAVAVSGGADSMALAVLARSWSAPRGGSTLALVVDHGLRQASADEARITIERLSQLGLSKRLLPLSDLRRGSALAERARIMRYRVLADACRQAGIVHLLLGHHAADQVETLAMRVLRGSQTHGLSGMSAVVETVDLHLLRPLLEIRPALLRDMLNQLGIGWVEDPSNQDTRATRVRMRRRLVPERRAEDALVSAVAAVARVRSNEEVAAARELAIRATIRPEGFALLLPGRIGSTALSRLVRTISGGRYPSSPSSINTLAMQPKPATIAGTRIMPAGRLGSGWLIVREEAAIMEPTEAFPETIWDNRFRLATAAAFPAGMMIGKLGADAAWFRKRSDLPSAVLRTLPAVRVGKDLAAVPHLGYISDEKYRPMIMLFAPRTPLAGLAFAPGS